MKTKAVSRSVAASILSRKLGAIRAWNDFLMDNARGKQDIGGYTLLPCGKVCERGRRPIYDIRDINAFIVNVKASGLAAHEPEKIVAIDIDIDPETLWFNRLYDSDGRTLH